jgi:FlaA1/EpsC-like NDP-sugar epimerase
MLAREMVRRPDTGVIPIGYLDDDPTKRKKRFYAVPVLGTIDDMARVAMTHDIEEILIAMPSEGPEVIRRVLDKANEANLPHRAIPGIFDILNGSVNISQLREVAIEDLLRRSPVTLDTTKIASYIHGRTVLVTGAGGSIGSEIVRQICAFDPARIILFGRGENSIFHIDAEMARLWPNIPRVAVIGDVRDSDVLDSVFRRHRPDVVFHAAAHKHVPLMEANPDQAIFNNVGGTKNLVELALQYEVERFVNVSTDKAVNPTSIMGASKRVAEEVVACAALRAAPVQQFVSVRFGNVLGSRGSVIPFFKEQIKRGGPVTVTHEGMTRYFMTIPEASQLVLQAGSLGENGTVFVLDMGEPVRIIDLANDLIRLSGLEPGRDIEIEITGLRPGEKLFEELLTAEEGTSASMHEKIFRARRKPIDAALFEAQLESLFACAEQRDSVAIRSALASMIPVHTLKPVELTSAVKSVGDYRLNGTYS